jgi:dipeptidyl-peptidase-4
MSPNVRPFWATAFTALASLVCMSIPASAEPARLSIERAYASPSLNGPAARGVAMSPDGLMVTYLKSRSDNVRVTDLWAADVAGGEPRRLIDAVDLIPKDRELSEAEKSRRERQGIQSSGVVDYAWDEQGRFILVPVEGDLWLYERAAGSLKRLTNSEADEIDAKVSPKGSFVSFVRNDNLVIVPSQGGSERALTTSGTELKSWATAEFIAQEEMSRSTGYWWSPDETRIALTYVDQSGVDVVPRFDISGSGTTVVEQRYPRVGRPNAVVKLFVADVGSGTRVEVDLGANTDIYLARVNWSIDGKTLYVQRESRDQRRLDLIAVDPATGKGRVILSETSPHWIELTDDFHALKDGNFLWTSERDGNRHIYLFSTAGKLVRQVTKGDWPVDAIEGVDEARGLVVFGASKDTPIDRGIYSVSYKSSAVPNTIVAGKGWWRAAMAKNGSAFVGSFNDPKTPPRTGLYKADGTLVRWIEENSLAEGHPYWPYHERMREPTFGKLKAADGQDLWWSITTPPGFDPARKYPVLIEVYGGPAGQTVTRTWSSPGDQLFLEAGYILFSIDNRGTPNRSVAFKTALDRKVGEVEVADQLLGVKYLQSLPYVDPARIGVWGWSNGGYMTLMLLTAPDSPYAAGIAGAPPTDWTLYDTHYTERFMGTLGDNATGYANSEVTARLGNLKPHSLMLMHGMADDNVTYDNTTRVMAALQAKAIPFEEMAYPGLRHRAGWTLAHQRHRMQTELDYFARKLSPISAP